MFSKYQDIISSNSDFVRKLDDDTFRIKINLQLRRLGVIGIIFSRYELEISANNFNISVPNYGDLTKILDEIYEQLLNPVDNLPAYAIKVIWEYINSIEVELGLIVTYFEHTAIKR